MEKQELKYRIFRDGFKCLSLDCQQFFSFRFKGKNVHEISIELRVLPNYVYQKMYKGRESLIKYFNQHQLYKYIKSLLFLK